MGDEKGVCGHGVWLHAQLGPVAAIRLHHILQLTSSATNSVAWPAEDWNWANFLFVNAMYSTSRRCESTYIGEIELCVTFNR